MSKGERSKKTNNRKYKEKKTFQLVNEIIAFNSQVSSRQRYGNFVINYNGKNFDDVLRILIKNSKIRALLSFFEFNIENANYDIKFKDIGFDKLISVLLLPLETEKDRLLALNKANNLFEIYLVNGSFDKASNIINEFEQEYGTSIWSIRSQLLLLNESNEYEKIELLIAKYNEVSGSNIKGILSTHFQLFESADSKMSLEKTIIRDNNELLDGDALPLASTNSLLFLPYPLFDGIDSLPALYHLQSYNAVDLYLYLKEIAIRGDMTAPKNNESDNGEVHRNRIQNFVHTIDPQWNIKNQLVNKHLDLYINGEYSEIIRDLETNTLEIENAIINLNIYAKCYIYLNEKPNEKFPPTLYRCINNLFNIYSMNDIEQSITELISISINTIGYDISKHIQIAIEKALPYNSKTKKKQLTSQLTHYTHIANTPLSEELEYIPLMYSNIENDISIRGKAKRSILENIDEIPMSKVEKYLSFNPLEKDYIELKAIALLKKEMHEELLNFIVDELIKNRESYICFPMEKVSSYIEDNYLSSADAVIFCHFYSQLPYDENKHLLHETFEEYFCDFGIQRPMELFDQPEKITDKCFFILMYVAKTKVMDYIACFKDTSDLMYERINILANLKKDIRSDNNIIEKELHDTINELLIINATTKLTTSKIFVDKNQILEINKSKINTLVNQFFQNKDKQSLLEENLFFITEHNILIELYNLIAIDFFTNTEVGLDSNLSGEIRHTFFSNLMSSKLQERKLITELGVDGKYKSNTYWIEQYKIVNKKIVNTVDERLAIFSNDFHTLLDRVESWMKVTAPSDPECSVFDFSNTEDKFLDIKKELKEKTDQDEILQCIFFHIDLLLDECLNSMRTKLNNDFSNMLDDLFNELLSDLNRIKLGASLTELVSDIEKTRNDIKEDIRTVSEWFNLKNEIAFETYPIYEVIKISERCLNQGSYNECSIITTQEHDRIIDGKYVSGIIMALINCFTNAIKHSVNNSPIEVEIKSENDLGYKIVVINEITSSHKLSLINGGLEEIQLRLASMTSNSLLVKEGGTGLYKSKYKLKKLSDKFDIQVKMKDDQFITKVVFNA